MRVYSNSYNFKPLQRTLRTEHKVFKELFPVVSSQFRLVHDQETVRHMLTCKMGVANMQELKNPASESCSSNNERKTVKLKKTNLEKRCNFRIQYTVSTNRYPWVSGNGSRNDNSSVKWSQKTEHVRKNILNRMHNFSRFFSYNFSSNSPLSFLKLSYILAFVRMWLILCIIASEHKSNILNG